MGKISRRDAIVGMITAGAAALAGSDVEAQQKSDAAAFVGRHEPRPLPFDPAKLTGISEKVIRSHWENNYGGSVRALNSVEQRLAAMMKDKDLPPFVYGDLKREELIRTGSVVLHEQYFANLGGNGNADGNALKLIEKWFGSYADWEAEFRRTANALSGGSGWAILAYNQHTKQLHNYWAADHAHNAPFSVPLLVLDMYEHSYHMDYGAAAGKYVDAFMRNVNWEEVNRRAESARIPVAESPN
jgi:Fe-Mn family superoxide dismutase